MCTLLHVHTAFTATSAECIAMSDNLAVKPPCSCRSSDARLTAVEELKFPMPPSVIKIRSTIDEQASVLSASQKLGNGASRELTGIDGGGTSVTGVTSQVIASPLTFLRAGRLGLRASMLWVLLFAVLLIACSPIILQPRGTASSTDLRMQRHDKRRQWARREQQLRRRELATIQFEAGRRAAVRFTDPSGPWFWIA